MNIGVWIFSAATAISLLAYLYVCWRFKVRPQMNDLFGLSASSLTLAGAFRVLMFAFSVPSGKTAVLISDDLTLGAALVMSAICLFWKGIDTIVTTINETCKKCLKAPTDGT
jgi:hypothetical protein